MNCLWCNQILQEKLSFASLLCLKKRNNWICPTCFSSFEKIGEERCPSCFKAGVSIKCQDCQRWCQEGIEVQHRAMFKYNSAMRDFFSRYKFDGDYLLRKIFTPVLTQELKQYKQYAIVVIPLSSERLEHRGFNQVEGFIQETGLPYLDILVKRDVDASSSKSRRERLSRELPFFIREGVKIPPKILLFDDIYTTGATVNRVKHLLEEAGCQDVKTFSLAR